ncbi:hypothetical protein TYRP_009533 [Tyrophagus putrescentiae]|nr:hypothetical protein TYRP_009533 [Tyrophagus putrescentiae]
MIDLKAAKLSFNVLLIVQVFLLFFIAVVNFTSDETPKTSTSLYDLVKPVDKGKLLQLFIGPLNLVGLIYSASTHFTLLIVYIPVRWTLAAYLVAACTAKQPLLYSGGLLLEVMIETALGLFIWRLWQQKKRTGGDNTQQTSDLPHQKDPHPFDKQKAGQVSITVFDSLPLPSYLEAVRENPGPQKTTLPKH